MREAPVLAKCIEFRDIASTIGNLGSGYAPATASEPLIPFMNHAPGSLGRLKSTSTNLRSTPHHPSLRRTRSQMSLHTQRLIM